MRDRLISFSAFRNTTLQP